FRFMLQSGTCKLLSGDPTWRDLSALQYHYWTQPLPAPTSHFVHHLPAGVHHASAALMFAVEIVLPFFCFGPRPLRLLAALGFVGLQAVIAATGNYGFFNLLVVVLCVALLDDRALRRVKLARAGATPAPAARAHALVRAARGTAVAALVLLSLLVWAQRY